MGEIQHRSLGARLVLHPIFKTRRSSLGRLETILGPGDGIWADGRQESFIAVYLDPLDEAAARDLTQALSGVLGDVRAAVTDWQSMVAKLERAVFAIENTPPPVAPGVLSEALAFCRWLRDGHFTFLGTREFRLANGQDTGNLVPVENSGLGVLRDPAVHVLSRGGEPLAMTPESRRFFSEPEPLIVAKSNILSRIHRRMYMDYVGIKTYSKGVVSGELRIVGLLTSGVYTQSSRQIPFLRRRVETVLTQSGFPPASHAGKALAQVLETFPRDELFQIEEDTLKTWAHGILDLDLRPRVRLFVRFDRFDRFVSALAYIPRDRFSSRVRERIGQVLADAYNGRVTTFAPYFTEGPLVRVHFIVGRNEGPRPEVSEAELEAKISDIARTWDDRLASALKDSDPAKASLAETYGRAFSAGYAETFPVARALKDIARIERLGPERPVAVDFYREDGAPAHRVRAAMYRFDRPIPLSERVPILENLGFSVIDERSYRVAPQMDGKVREVALHDMVLETPDGAPIALDLHAGRMEEGVLAVFRGEADNDGFNRLIVAAGADWREVAALRAYGAYLRQIRAPFGLRYIADTLSRHAGLARDLVELFRVRFDPDRKLAVEA
ncbi:MAG: NAD-glutamate dehydrogenase, partial [Hyphomicrobiaceae bacterium]